MGTRPIPCRLALTINQALLIFFPYLPGHTTFVNLLKDLVSRLYIERSNHGRNTFLVIFYAMLEKLVAIVFMSRSI